MLVCLLAAVGLWGCASLPWLPVEEGPSAAAKEADAFIFVPTAFMAENPWIEAEIREFLSRDEVKMSLGFDPLHYRPISVHIQEFDIYKGFGTQSDARTWINGYVFSARMPTPSPDPNLHGARGDAGAYPNRPDMLGELRADPEMLKLYRGLLVAHEIAHVGEWYAARLNAPVTLTGHGVTNRVEIHILTNLYLARKIDPETWEKLFSFFERHLNTEHQPKDDIAAYYAANFVDRTYFATASGYYIRYQLPH